MQKLRLCTVFLCIAGWAAAQPNVPANSVVNGASFAAQQAVAPGSLVSIFGTGLATTMSFPDTIPISTTLGQVTVAFNGKNAPLLATVPGSSSSQINAQIPWDVLPAGTTTGSIQLVVTVNNVSSNTATVQLDAMSPGIFTMNSQGTGQAAAQVNNSTGAVIFAAPSGTIAGAPQSRPIQKSEILIIYATGLGAVDKTPANGDIPRLPSGVLAHTTTMPTIMFGGVAATDVGFSGLSPQFVGLYQINVTVPAGAPSGNAVPLQIQMGNVTSTDQVTIAIQ
jgi:uncharacterized protein (TIGR03437 family)